MKIAYNAIFVALACLTILLSADRVAFSQSTGNKAVFGSSGLQPSTIWIDASAWWTSSTYGNDPDICKIIDQIIQIPYSSPVVIDARGLYNNQGTGSAAIPCAVNPFQHATSSLPATTVLLPAASISVSTTWILPNSARIVGEGQNTNLVAGSGLSGYIVEMGSSSMCPTGGYCSSVGVEHMLLQSNGAVGGIYNGWSQTGSYVNDVNFRLFGCASMCATKTYVGLQVDPGATNSGPYSNLTYSTASSAVASLCADIETQTLGIHGFTCTGNASTANAGPSSDAAGIIINSGNNSVEDVHLESFWDGIEIGNTTARTVGDVIVSNVTGTQSGSGCTSGMLLCVVQNVIHICGANSNNPSGRGTCANSGSVSDVELLNILVGASYYATVVAAVQDDSSGTSIVKCGSSISTCAIPTTATYSLGESVAGGYSRFATNPSNPTANYDASSSIVPTWGVGINSVSTNTSCLTPGALYSNLDGISGSSLYVCTYGSSGFVWKPIA